MGKWTGRVYESFEPGRITGTLTSFAIDSAALHPEHCAWLDKHIVPALAGGGSVGISGLASRSGSGPVETTRERRSRISSQEGPQTCRIQAELVRGHRRGDREIFGPEGRYRGFAPEGSCGCGVAQADAAAAAQIHIQALTAVSLTSGGAPAQGRGERHGEQEQDRRREH